MTSNNSWLQDAKEKYYASKNNPTADNVSRAKGQYYLNKYEELGKQISDSVNKLNINSYVSKENATKDQSAIDQLIYDRNKIAKHIINNYSAYGMTDEGLAQFKESHISNASAQDKISSYTKDRLNYYGQFKDEADYNTQKKNAGYYDKYKNYSVAELAELISKTPEGSEEYDFLTEFRGNKLYDEYSKFTDEQMAEIEAEYNKYYDANGRYQMLERKALNPHMSKITDAELRELEGMRARKREFESKYDYKLIEQVRAQDKAQKEYVLPYLEKPDFNNNSATIKIGKNNVDFKLGIAMLEGAPAFIEYGDFSRNMQRATDEQKSVFAYIYNTQGQEAAKEWYEKLEPTLSYNASAKTQQEWKDFANENWFNAVLTQIAARGTNIIKGGVAISDIISNIAGVEIDPYDSAHTLVQFAPVVTQEVTKNWGPFGSYAYQLGMGMVDFGAQLLLSKGVGKAAGLSSAATSNIALGIMGTGAAADTITTAKLSGASDSQAIALGAMSGIIEVLCEKASIETLFGSSKGKLSYFLKNAFTEASEEGISSVANIITDMIIMSDKSEVETLAQKYLEGFTDSKGVYHKASTKAEALAMAITSKAPDVLLDALGGFISGGVLGGISLVSSSISANKAANNIINKNNTQGLIDLGLEMPKDSVAYDTAVSLKERLESTTADKAKKSVAKLYDSIRQEIGDVVSKYEGNKDAAAYTDYNRALNQYETLNNLVKSTDNIVAPNQETTQNIATDIENNAEISAENDLTANVETVAADIKSTIEGKNEGANETVAKPSGEQTGTNGDMGVAQATKKAPQKNANKGIWTEGDMTPKQRDYMDNLVRKMGGVDTSLTEGQNYAKAVGKALGRNVYFKKMIGDGYIEEETGDIYISKNNTNPLNFVLKHELVHFSERNTFKYQDFQDAIIKSEVFAEWLKEKGYDSLKEYEAYIEDLYKKAEEERKKKAPKQDPIVLGKGGATKEIIANFVGERLFTEDGSTLQKLINGLNPSKKQRFLEVFRDFINWLKGKFTKSADKQMQLDIERFENMFIKIYNKAQSDFQNKNTPTEEAGVRYAIFNHKGNKVDVDWDSDNYSSLSTQLKNNIHKIENMEIVDDVHFKHTDGKSLYNLVKSSFKKIGFKVDVQNFGEIALDENAINLAVNSYINNDAEAAALLTIPKVLKRGKIISGHQNHKGRNYPTITFAAPVRINGKKGNVVVAVKITGKTRYNAHRILMPDGSEFVLDNEKNTELQSARMNKQDIVQRSAKSSVSNYSIPTTGKKVNINLKNSQFDIIQETNPMWDEYHTGIRSADDIRTWEEVLELDDEREGQFVWGDFSRTDAEQALKDGVITVYSSYPIKNGVFVSTSYAQAQEYAGGKNGKVYSKIVPLTDVAWINGDEGQYAKVNNTALRYSIPDTKADREYLNAVESGDMETAQRLVDEAAKKAGYPVKVYHGTGNFGFTQFKDGLIFTTNDPSISAGYTNNKGYGRKRSIAEAYTEDNGSVETLIKNAKNVLGWNLHQITEAEHKQYVEDIKQSSAELSDKVNEVWQRESIDALPNLTEELDNDISWVLSLPGSINENIDDVVLYAEDMQRWVEHFNESRERVREYLVKNRDALKDTPAWSLYQTIMGYELGDFAIDVEYKLLKSIDGNSLVSETGGIVTQDSIRSQVEAVKDVGSYILYGSVGNNPLVIDGKGAMWTDIYVNEWGGHFSTDSIGKKAKEQGYTSVQIKDIYDMSMNEYAVNKKSDVYIFFDSNQVKSADPITYDDNGNVIPLSERFNKNEEDIRYSVPDVQDGREAELQKLYRSGDITQEEYELLINKRRGNTTPGEIIKTPKGEADTTPELARRTGKARGDGESKFYDSIQDSNILSDAFKEEAKSNDFIKRYERIANKETMKDAAEALANGGRKYVNSWFAKKPTQFSAEDVCVGFILLDRYQKVKDYDSASAVAEKLREAGTVSGQTVQAFSILGRFTPEMMIAYAKKDLDSAYKTMIEGKSAEWVKRNKEKFKLTEDEQNFIRRKMVQASELPEGRDKNIRIAEINAMLQNKLPAEKGQAYKALQRISMLLNPKTNVRNVLGNALMVPIHLVDDFISTGVDTLVSKKTGFRTIGAPINAKENVKAFAQGAYESWDDFRRRISTRDVEMNRFDIGQGKSFREDYNFEARNKLGKALNALDRTTSFLLELGDRPFFQMWFINSLNNQMRINKVSEATAEMIEIATQEALERTWQDTNSFTKAVTGIKNGLNKITGEEFYNTFGYGLGDLFIKFTKTPANLTKAMVEFSPVGLVKALSLDAISFSKAVKTGQLTAAKQRKFVNNISKGITGTLLYVLFSALARAGITQGGGDEDKDVAAFEKNVLGIQPYSVKIGNSSFSYEWAQPIGAIMAITADIYQNGEGAKGEKQEWYNNILDAFKSGGKVLFNQSFMKGIQNFFEEDGFVTAMIDGALDEPAIFIPQFVSQTAGMFDDTSRTSFVYDDSLKSSLYGVLSKIPGARNTLPAQFDVFGRDVKNPYNDIINAYINPANPRTDNSTPVSKELYEVYKQTGDKSVIPAVAPYYLTINDEKKVFTTEERQKYQQLTGGESAKQINNLLDDPAYKMLSADVKAEVIKDIYAYNTAQAKEELFGKELTATQKKIEKYDKMGLDPEIYILVKTLQDGTKKASYEKAVDSVKLDPYTKKLLLALNDAEGKKNEDALVEEAFKNYNK